MQPLLNSSPIAETALVCFHESAIHGTGGFAKTDIAAGTRAIEYTGEKITKAESLRRCESDNEYIFSLGEESDLDGNVPGNPAAFSEIIVATRIARRNRMAGASGLWHDATSGPGRKSRSTTDMILRITGSIRAAAAWWIASVTSWRPNFTST